MISYIIVKINYCLSENRYHETAKQTFNIFKIDISNKKTLC